MAHEKCKECQRDLVLDEENMCAYCELTQEMSEKNTSDVNCGICKVIVEEDSEGLFCDVCDSWFHNDCNETPLEYELYALMNEAPKNIKWFCDKCIWVTEKWIKALNNKKKKTSKINKKINDVVHEEENEDHSPAAVPEIKLENEKEKSENEDMETEEANNSDEWVPTDEKEEVINIKQKKKKKKVKPREEIVCDNIRTISETIEAENISDLLDISPEKLSNITDGVQSVKNTKTKYTRSKCNLCPKSFIHFEDCIAHKLCDHEGVQMPYKCSVCKSIWETKRGRERHLARHFGLKKYSKEIDNTLENEEALQAHVRIHTGHKTSLQSNELLQCKDKQIPKIEGNTHVTKENKVPQGLLHSLKKDVDEFDKSYEENYAEPVEANESKESDEDYIDGGAESEDSSYSEGSDYIANSCKENQYRLENLYLCSQCNMTFAQKSDLKSHMKTHSVEKQYQCKYCDRAFELKASLKSHIRSHPGEKPYQCNLCNKVFRNSSMLPAHMKTHSGERPYLCNHCGKAFKQYNLLKQHMKIHTGEKPYVCNHCGKAFIRNSHLKKHLKIHSGEKSYLCNLCGKAFAENDHLRRHLKTHTREKPYPCSYCDNTFNRRDQLMRHQRIHTGEKPFKCTHCSKGYSHNRHLKNHLRTHTEGENILMQPV